MSKIVNYVKYPNRRIYDTESSGYVSFQGIKKKILEGYEIVVRDNKTKEDVTREVLISILMEETIIGEPLFSEDLMKMIIQFYGNPMQSIFTSSLDQGLRLMSDFLSTAVASRNKAEGNE